MKQSREGGQSSRGACLSCSRARASWSGQLVFLAPQRMPSILRMTSSIFCPRTNWLIPCQLPLHPPRKNTCWITLFSSAVTSIMREHVPCVSYCTCFVFIMLSVLNCYFVSFSRRLFITTLTLEQAISADAHMGVICQWAPKR